MLLQSALEHRRSTSNGHTNQYVDRERAGLKSNSVCFSVALQICLQLNFESILQTGNRHLNIVISNI